MAYQSIAKSPRVAGNPRLRKRMRVRMQTNKKYGLGGLIGSGIGTAVGTFAGNPALGMQLGGMAGNFVEGQIDGEGEEGQPRLARTTSGGSYGVFATGGYTPMGGAPRNLKAGDKAYGFSGRSHEAGGIDLRPGVEIEGNETMDTINGKEYVFSDRVNLPGKKKSFAQRHKELKEQGASRSAIKALKKMQERVTGRDVGGGQQSWGTEGYVQFGKGGDINIKDSKKGTFTKAAKKRGMGVQEFASKVMNNKDQYSSAMVKKANFAKNASKWNGAYGGEPDPPNRRMYGPTENDRPMGFGQYIPPSIAADTTGVYSPAMRGRGPQTFPGQSASNYNQWGNVGMHNFGPRDKMTMPQSSKRSGNVAMRGRSAPRKPTIGVSAPQDVIMDQDVELGYMPMNGRYMQLDGNNMSIDRADLPSREINTPSRATQKAVVPPASDAEVAANGDTANATATGEDASGDPTVSNMALQMAPDVLNALTGIFGKDKTRKATRVAPTQIRRSYKGYNINPLLQKNLQGYRSILSDPSATRNQKFMSQMIKQRGDQSAYAEKENRDQQAAMRYDLGQARLDSRRNSRQAGFNERYRQDKMQSEANLGPTGNFARGAYASIANKQLMARREKNMSEADKRMLEMYRKVYGGI